MIYTSKDLLKIAVELRDLEPNLAKWDKDYFKDNPPRLQRLLMVDSLCKAFNIENIESLFNGDFILRNHNNYKAFANEIDEKIALLFNEKPEYSTISTVDFFKWPYRRTLNYRCRVEGLFSINNTMLLPNSLDFYVVPMTEKINNSIIENLSALEKFLCDIIDPIGNSFEEEYLIEEFNFPKNINLKEIDLIHS